MKNMFFIISLLIANLSFSQLKGKVTYRISMVKDSLEKPYENPENTDIENDVLEMMNNAQPVEAYLIFNDSIAIYNVQPNTEIPSWNNNSGDILVSKAAINLTWIFAGGEGINYTDWSRNWDIRQNDIFGVTKRIKQDPKNWIFTEDKKDILGYNCLKATIQNSKIEVWYAPNIPVNHGPKGYNGLPGLVLEVKQGKNFLFEAEKIELDNEVYKSIKEPLEGQIIEAEDYKKLGKLYLSGEKN